MTTNELIAAQTLKLLSKSIFKSGLSLFLSGITSCKLSALASSSREIIACAGKFYNCEKEDLIQVGVIGLLKAYQNFNDTGETQFSTYAYTYIFGEMYALANQARNSFSISLFLILNHHLLHTSKFYPY